MYLNQVICSGPIQSIRMLGQVTIVPRIIVPRLVLVEEEDALTQPFPDIVEDNENELNEINLTQIKEHEHKIIILKVKVLKDGDHSVEP